MDELLGQRHLTASQLLALVLGKLTPGAARPAEAHLEICLVCRVWANRLRHVEDASWEPAGSAHIERLLADSAVVSPAVAAAMISATVSPSGPAPGELWRVGRDEALLVWVRRILDGAIAVVPVVLDPDLADENTLLISEEDSPIGLELAVMASVEAHLAPRAFLQCFGVLPCAEEIELLRAARHDGKLVTELPIGAPIETEQDERIEYRQSLSDLLGDMSPDSYDQEGDTGDAGLDLIDMHAELRELQTRRFGTFWRRLDEVDRQRVDDEHTLITVAAVDELDTTLLVAALVGPRSGALMTESPTAVACGALQRRYQAADGVAVAVAGAECSGVVVPVAYTHDGIEPPGGVLEGPRVTAEPLRLVDALFKYLDAHSTNWDDDSIVALGAAGETDLAGVAAIAVAQAQAAVSATLRSAESFRLQEKKDGYATLNDQTAVRISDAVRAITQGGSVAAALDALLTKDRP